MKQIMYETLQQLALKSLQLVVVIDDWIELGFHFQPLGFINVLGQLVVSLPSNVLAKYEDRCQEEAINLAGLDDLVRCVEKHKKWTKL